MKKKKRKRDRKLYGMCVIQITKSFSFFFGIHEFIFYDASCILLRVPMSMRHSLRFPSLICFHKFEVVNTWTNPDENASWAVSNRCVLTCCHGERPFFFVPIHNVDRWYNQTYKQNNAAYFFLFHNQNPRFILCERCIITYNW